MNSFKRVAIKDLMVEMKKIKVKADAVDNHKNTSLVAKGANRLQHLTAYLIQNGQQGLEIGQTQ